jgi:hypothetical protein
VVEREELLELGLFGRDLHVQARTPFRHAMRPVIRRRGV